MLPAENSRMAAEGTRSLRVPEPDLLGDVENDIGATCHGPTFGVGIIR